MNKNINCINNDQGAWCKDKRIKKSLFGIGARLCLVFGDKKCKYQQPYPRPIIEPPSSTKK